MTVGLVVATFGTPHYIALHLEASKRFVGERTPIMCHDDHSPERNALERLCGARGACFYSTRRRLGWQLGDIHSFLAGLEWAADQKLTYLVKFSRRFLPLVNWLDDFVNLAERSGGVTFSAPCTHWNYGFRTEALGMKVEAWLPHLDKLREKVKGGKIGLPEWEMDQIAQAVSPDRYTTWPLLGTSRRQRREEVMWHETYTEQEYLALARQWGLS